MTTLLRPTPVRPPVPKPGWRLLSGACASAVSAALLAGCGGGDDDDSGRHAVYAMTNASAGNQVIGFHRADDGTLTALGSFPTGGNGNGRIEVSAATPDDGIDVLASQGAIQMSPDKRTMVAVNAASATITSFHIEDDGRLTRVSVVASGGLQPNAVTVGDNRVYVSNVGATSNAYASNVTGFQLAGDATLTPIAGAVANLSTPTAQPARVLLNPAGTTLVVSELTTNRISVYPVRADGTLGAAVASSSSGQGPFGSVFLPSGALLVTEAGSKALSSYSVGSTGTLTTVSASVVNGQAATCWVITSPDGATAYTSNAGAGTLASYRIGSNGALTLLQAVASTLEGATSGVGDEAVSEDGKFLYALNGGLGSITALKIQSDGTLTKVQTIGGNGLPALGAQGLVAR